MAAGKVTVLNVALDKLGRKVFDLDADAFNVVLTTNAQALSAAFTGTSGQARYSDLTAEVVGAGYTAGGAPLGDATWTRSGAVLTFAADPTAWSALTATMKYAVICLASGTKDILAIVDLETTDAAGRTSAGGDFIINWTGGLFTLTRAA